MTRKILLLWLGAFVGAGVVAAALLFLFLDIHQKQEEGRQYPLMMLKVDDDHVDPALWGKNFPVHYDQYLQMNETGTATQYGGGLPYSKLLRYPQLVRLWAGYPFSVDYNQKRSHYFSQIDQLDTRRTDTEWLKTHGFPSFQGQPGACMNCHSGWTPKLIRELGWGTFNKTPYRELSGKLVESYGDSIHGGTLGSTCADCHSPDDMSLRVTRPAYIKAMVARGYEADTKQGIKASRRQMRSHVCQQCHVEYYFQKETKELTFPWKNWPKDAPLQIEMIEAYYDAARKDDHGFQYDWLHKETGAPMLKMQHPETELFSSGIHARSGVACADCHMPYQRQGAVKYTTHKIQSPLFSINASCQTCHQTPEADIAARVNFIQHNTASATREAEGALLALIDDIKQGVTALKESERVKSAAPTDQEKIVDDALGAAREFHRRASMRWDFVASENSTGFHSPQEAMRILSQATELARQGQLALQQGLQPLGIVLRPTVGRGALPADPPIATGRTGIVGSPPPAWIVELDRERHTPPSP